MTAPGPTFSDRARTTTQRQLVGHHEPEGPPRQAEDGAHRLVAEVRRPVQPQAGPAQARDHEPGLGHHTGGRAQAEEQDLPPVGGHAGQRGVAHRGAEDEQHRHEHDVVGDGREHGRPEPRRALSSAVPRLMKP